MSWFSARDYCRGMDGRLVSLDTQEKYAQLKEVYEGNLLSSDFVASTFPPRNEASQFQIMSANLTVYHPNISTHAYP